MSPSELGGLVITPGQGQDISSVRMHTSGGCPTAADAYYAVLRGKGFPQDGQIVTATTDVGLSHTAGFDVYLAQTLRDFAADNKTILQGKYEVIVRCIESFSQTSHGEFTASLEFGSPTKYAAVGPAKGPDRVPEAPNPTLAEAEPAPPPPAPSTTVASMAPPSAAPIQAAPHDSGSVLPIIVLAGFAVAVAVVIGTTAVLRRRGSGDEGANDA